MFYARTGVHKDMSPIPCDFATKNRNPTHDKTFELMYKSRVFIYDYISSVIKKNL